MGPTIFDFEKNDFREVEILERNGNLTYVEFEDDGSTDWVDNQAIEHRGW